MAIYVVEFIEVEHRHVVVAVIVVELVADSVFIAMLLGAAQNAVTGLCCRAAAGVNPLAPAFQLPSANPRWGRAEGR